ncbi:MAG: hypothetical protein IJN46_07145 [Lachnospiraceae bacterium]|nr:hypothetical protein [Lachnospiraceae bacterium]
MTSDMERNEIQQIREQMVKKSADGRSVRTADERLKERMIHENAMKLGINLKMTDSAEKENNYRNLALLYVLEGKEVPEDLLEKIILEDQRQEEKSC